MATEVVMPKFGMTMVEGTLAAWLAADGSTVQQGTPIFRLTTEKIDYEVEADAAGILRHAAAEEQTLVVGAVVGYILAAGEAPPSGLGTPPGSPAAAPASLPLGDGAASGAAANGAFVRATPASRRLARDLHVALHEVRGSGPEGRVTEADVRDHAARPAPAREAAAPAASASADGLRATPLARRIAQEQGVDLASVRGSGPGGRIQQEDVERAVAERAAAPAPAARPAASRPAAASESLPYKGLRKTIGDRMQASLQGSAQLTLMADADVTDLVKLRGQLVEEWTGDGVRVSYTDLVIKAAAKALRDHPRVNASLTGDTIAVHDEVHVGMAVALDEGLIVPVIRDADRKPLKQIAAESAALAEKARTNKLGLDDVSGGTFSVTSLGMYGVDGFTPIINPPQVAILGVGRIRDALALEEREVVKRSMLTLSLTIDHRILDGAPAAAFLGRVRALLERPFLLCFE